MNINEPCRVSIEELDHDHRNTVNSLFDCADVVHEYDEHRAESRKKNIAAYCRKQNAINKEAARLKANRAMDKQVEASK